MAAGEPTGTAALQPRIGIGYRHGIDGWIRANLPRFDVLEITLDHCLAGSKASRAAIFDLVGQIPLTAHGIGLSIGTGAPLDVAYLDTIAVLLDRLRAPAYSEHLAFTRVPGRELGNLLPLPRTQAVAESIIAKVKTVQARIPVPFLLENITYMFDWPDSELTDAEFLTLICRETGAGLLLDLENLYLNSSNHGFDAHAFLDALPAGLVREIHIAGGMAVSEPFLSRPLLVDTHSYPVPAEALALLDRTLLRQAPAAIVVERDDRIEATDEIIADVDAIRDRVAARSLSGSPSGLDLIEPTARPAYPRSARAAGRSTGPSMRRSLSERQASLVEYLTSGGAIIGGGNLSAARYGLNCGLLHLEAKYSHQKRMGKIEAVLRRTLDLLGTSRDAIVCAFIEACPPASIGGLDNSRQFHAFLIARWREQPPEPPYLPDIAAFEIAHAAVQGDHAARAKDGAKFGAIRRHPAVGLLRCAYDITPMLEGTFTSGSASPPTAARRETYLALAMLEGTESPVVHALSRELFTLIELLNDFADPEIFKDFPEGGLVFESLAKDGLIEVSR